MRNILTLIALGAMIGGCARPSELSDDAGPSYAPLTTPEIYAAIVDCMWYSVPGIELGPVWFYDYAGRIVAYQCQPKQEVPGIHTQLGI
jgi:hypothetical protein